jgi:predicted nucleic acid-binding protein
MILVDTSVWVDHLRRRNSRLTQLLLNEEVLCHAFIIGELACSQMRHRAEVLSLLRALPRAPHLDDDETLAFLDTHPLMGRRLGWIDVHLLASTLLSHASLWSLDRQLMQAAMRLGSGFAVH